MKKKVDYGLVFGYILLTFGVFSSLYAITMLIIQIVLVPLGIVVYVKDLLFDIIFLLLGLILIRKKRKKTVFHSARQVNSKSF
ncbi:MAG: hypothetical protein ACFE8N_02650 [Promethearchaeota archaeon]